MSYRPELLLERFGPAEWSNDKVTGITAHETYLSEHFALQRRSLSALLYWLDIRDWLNKIDDPLLTGARFEVFVEYQGQLLESGQARELYRITGGSLQAWLRFSNSQPEACRLWIATQRLDSPGDSYSYSTAIDSDNLWRQHVEFWPAALATAELLSMNKEPLPISSIWAGQNPGQYAHAMSHEHLLSALLSRRVANSWLQALPTPPSLPLAPAHGDLILKNMILDRKNFATPQPRAIDWETVCPQPYGTDIAHYLVWPLLFRSSDSFTERFSFAGEAAAAAIGITHDEWQALLLWHTLREAVFWSADRQPPESPRLAFAEVISTLQLLF